MKAPFKGIYSALLTPFREDGSIHEPGLRQLVRYNLDVNQVDGLYTGGSSGENFLLSTAEKETIFRIVKEEAGDQAVLIAQVGSLNLKESCHLARLAADLGYDALSAVTPFYYKFSFPEILDYYNTITAAADCRMIVYSIPALTGVQLSCAQFAELYANPGIIGVKFTAADFFMLERLRLAFPEHLIFAGFDEMLLPAAVLGIDGAIGSTFNLNARRARRILELARQGQMAEALQLQHLTNDFIEEVLQNGLYGTLKLCLAEAGVESGCCRKPMGGYNPGMRERAKAIYARYFGTGCSKV